MVAEPEPDVVVLDLQMPGPPPAELLTAMAQVCRAMSRSSRSRALSPTCRPSSRGLVALHIPKTTDLGARARRPIDRRRPRRRG